jgi:hypothetical protein
VIATRRAARATLLLLALSAALAAALPVARLSGRVLDEQGQPLPGVTVTIDGPDGQRRVVTRDDGRFALDGLVPGGYGVTFDLVGFVEQHREIAVEAGAVVTLYVALSVGAVEPDLVVTPPSELIAEATAIGHLRIERTAPPEPCGQASGALHRAAVLGVARGHLASSIAYRQGGVGYCRTAAGQVMAPEALLVPGDELLVLLRGQPGRRPHAASRDRRPDRAGLRPVARGDARGRGPGRAGAVRGTRGTLAPSPPAP